MYVQDKLYPVFIATGAISSICGNEKRGVVDGNVYRVLSRLYNIREPIDTTLGKKTFQNIANTLVPKKKPGTYNQAIMDFGSIHCTKYNPKCVICPIQQECESFKNDVVLLRPIKNKKKTYRTRYFNYLFIQEKDSIIIQQRGLKDIWTKLYELPLIETNKEVNESFLMNEPYLQKFQIENIENNYKMNHNLSHQKFKISFWNIVVTNINSELTLKRIKIHEINDYPFPKPIEIYFQTEHQLNI